MNENELKHYGVLGMKWGQRKADRAGITYTYKSMGQKKYEKKLAKQQKKGASASQIRKTQSKLATFKKRDANRQAYADTTSVGKTIVKGLLLGPFGSGNYNRLRAAGHTRLGAAFASNILTSTLGLPVTLVNSREKEFLSSR